MAKKKTKLIVNFQECLPKLVRWSVVDAPPGEMIIAVTDEGELCRAVFVRNRTPSKIADHWSVEWRGTRFAKGKAVKNVMEMPCLVFNHQFQRDVFEEIRRIPYGNVLTYGEVADRAGYPRAARAVGTACRDSLISYIIPFHRVVGANGLGGYGFEGPEAKRKLLKAEGVIYR